MSDEAHEMDRQSLEILFRVDERTLSIVQSVESLRTEFRQEKDESRAWKAALEARSAAIEARVAAIESTAKEQRSYSKGVIAVLGLVAGAVVQVVGWLIGWVGNHK